MAKKFLYFVAICIVVFLVGRIGYELFQDELTEIALVPSAEFTPTEPMEANAYQDPDLWYSRPGIGVNDPARNVDLEGEIPDAVGDVPAFAVFFVHPTSYLSRDNWNAPIRDEEAERIARIYI
ncbi:MAG: DUF3089 domain-containing protein, partial [Erythrobacter sp.]